MDFQLHPYQHRQGHQHPSQIAGKMLPDQSKAAVGRQNREVLYLGPIRRAAPALARGRSQRRASPASLAAEAAEASSASLLGDAHDDGDDKRPRRAVLTQLYQRVGVPVDARLHQRHRGCPDSWAAIAKNFWLGALICVRRR